MRASTGGGSLDAYSGRKKYSHIPPLGMTAHEGAAKYADRYIDTNTGEEHTHRDNIPLLHQFQKNKICPLYPMCGERG